MTKFFFSICRKPANEECADRALGLCVVTVHFWLSFGASVGKHRRQIFLVVLSGRFFVHIVLAQRWLLLYFVDCGWRNVFQIWDFCWRYLGHNKQCQWRKKWMLAHQQINAMVFIRKFLISFQRCWIFNLEFICNFDISTIRTHNIHEIRFVCAAIKHFEFVARNT